MLDYFLLKKILGINKKDKFDFFKYFSLLNEKVLKKNKWLIKPLYYILYYFPTNWPYLIILWIVRKWWDIRLYINSNKDIIGKKYFKKDLSNYDINNNKYIYIIKKYFIKKPLLVEDFFINNQILDEWKELK